MVDILARYGIKEVADVTFYKILQGGEIGAPVLYLDTLKVSTTEQTAENTSARGGKGNAELVMWDYGKEITVTLEDALFSAKSMAIMYGVDPDEDTVDFKSLDKIHKTVHVSAIQVSGEDVIVSTAAGDIKIPTEVKFYDSKAKEVTAEGTTAKAKYEAAKATAAYATFDINVEGQEIVISAEKFPGTYYVTGDTYARSEDTGEDEFFQFIIPKAKVLSEVTLTMEAEGDPSTFNMNLKVLRPKDGKMMKLVKYNLASS